jgi:hypothetical protein
VKRKRKKKCVHPTQLADAAQTTMSDAIVRRTLRFTIVAIITVIATTGLILSYRGLFELIIGQWQIAGMKLGWGIAAAVAALLLIRYRGDLIDD